MPKRSKKIPSNHWSNVSEDNFSQYSNNVFLSPEENSISLSPSKLEKVSLTDFPELNRELLKMKKKSKKLKKINGPLSYANITKKNLPKTRKYQLAFTQNKKDQIPTFAQMTKKNLPIVEPKHVIEKLSIEEWLGRIKMQRYTKFFTEYLNIKYNYEILEYSKSLKIFKITLEDFMVNKEYAEEYAHVRKQYLPKKTKTKYRKDIKVLIDYSQSLYDNKNQYKLKYMSLFDPSWTQKQYIDFLNNYQPLQTFLNEMNRKIETNSEKSKQKKPTNNIYNKLTALSYQEFLELIYNRNLMFYMSIPLKILEDYERLLRTNPKNSLENSININWTQEQYEAWVDTNPYDFVKKYFVNPDDIRKNLLSKANSFKTDLTQYKYKNIFKFLLNNNKVLYKDPNDPGIFTYKGVFWTHEAENFQAIFNFSLDTHFIDKNYHLLTTQIPSKPTLSFMNTPYKKYRYFIVSTHGVSCQQLYDRRLEINRINFKDLFKEINSNVNQSYVIEDNLNIIHMQPYGRLSYQQITIAILELVNTYDTFLFYKILCAKTPYHFDIIEYILTLYYYKIYFYHKDTQKLSNESYEGLVKLEDLFNKYLSDGLMLKYPKGLDANDNYMPRIVKFMRYNAYNPPENQILSLKPDLDGNNVFIGVQEIDNLYSQEQLKHLKFITSIKSNDLKVKMGVIEPDDLFVSNFNMTPSDVESYEKLILPNTDYFGKLNKELYKHIQKTDPINMYITTKDLINFIYKHGNIGFDDQIVLLVNTCRGGERYDVVKSDTFNTLHSMSNATQKVFKKDSYKSRKNSINSMYNTLRDPSTTIYDYMRKHNK